MKIFSKLLFVLGIGVAALFIAFGNKPVLKDEFRDQFYIGAAINRLHFNGNDTIASELVKNQFNSITAANDMKWERIHPKPNQYNFVRPDEFVKFGEANKMQIIGHCLLWHAQTPDWVFQDSTGKPLTREALLTRLHDHIFTIMTRYKGRIHGYDVVNEALEGDGSYRQSNWYKIIGEDYIEKAFEYASQADPGAELYYNDFNIEQPAKREGTIKIIKNLQAKGIKITSVGIQGHYHLDMPKLKDVEESIIAFSQLGVGVDFTELDINVLPNPENFSGANIGDKFEYSEKMNPYSKELPDSMQTALANRYADFFKIFVKHKDKIGRITFWGVNDNDSWLNNWPIKGRSNYPLIFDRNNQPKKAFFSIIETAKGK